MKKIGEYLQMISNVSFLGKMHRIAPYSQLENICSYIYHLIQFFKSNKSVQPARFWLTAHMHEFIKQKLTDMDKNEPVDNLLQLMINAVHSDKVRILKFSKIFFCETPSIKSVEK